MQNRAQSGSGVRQEGHTRAEEATGPSGWGDVRPAMEALMKAVPPAVGKGRSQAGSRRTPGLGQLTDGFDTGSALYGGL